MQIKVVRSGGLAKKSTPSVRLESKGGAKDGMACFVVEEQKSGDVQSSPRELSLRETTTILYAGSRLVGSYISLGKDKWVYVCDVVKRASWPVSALQVHDEEARVGCQVAAHIPFQSNAVDDFALPEMDNFDPEDAEERLFSVLKILMALKNARDVVLASQQSFGEFYAEPVIGATSIRFELGEQLRFSVPIAKISRVKRESGNIIKLMGPFTVLGEEVPFLFFALPSRDLLNHTEQLITDRLEARKTQVAGERGNGACTVPLKLVSDRPDIPSGDFAAGIVCNAEGISVVIAGKGKAGAANKLDFTLGAQTAYIPPFAVLHEAGVTARLDLSDLSDAEEDPEVFKEALTDFLEGCGRLLTPFPTLLLQDDKQSPVVLSFSNGRLRREDTGDSFALADIELAPNESRSEEGLVELTLSVKKKPQCLQTDARHAFSLRWSLERERLASTLQAANECKSHDLLPLLFGLEHTYWPFLAFGSLQWAHSIVADALGEPRDNIALGPVTDVSLPDFLDLAALFKWLYQEWIYKQPRRARSLQQLLEAWLPAPQHASAILRYRQRLESAFALLRPVEAEIRLIESRLLALNARVAITQSTEHPSALLNGLSAGLRSSVMTGLSPHGLPLVALNAVQGFADTRQHNAQATLQSHAAFLGEANEILRQWVHLRAFRLGPVYGAYMEALFAASRDFWGEILKQGSTGSAEVAAFTLWTSRIAAYMTASEHDTPRRDLIAPLIEALESEASLIESSLM